MPVNLNVARADKAGDCRLNSVSEKLESILEEARDGRWSKCVVILYRDDGGTYFIDSRYAGCTNLEARGLMLSEIKSEIME